MLKKILLFMFSAGSILLSHAQVNETAFASARYTFLYVADTTDPGDVTSENMILYLGRNTSVYKSYDRMLRDSVLKEQMDKLKAGAMSGGTFNITVPPGKPGSSASFFKDILHSKLSRVESFMKNYLIEEEMPSINWTMTQETKDIQGLSCQKATAAFRGRNYSAWFSPQLSYNNGPWKLGGLPGLIVEAADEQNQVVFRFAGFEDVSSKNILIGLPADAIKATAKEYAQLREMAAKDPQGFINSSMAGMGNQMNIKSGNVSGGTFVPNGNAKRKVNNNPMERTSQ